MIITIQLPPKKEYPCEKCGEHKPFSCYDCEEIAYHNGYNDAINDVNQYIKEWVQKQTK